MNWNTLRYVVEIAQQRSFSKAARKLYLSQPSLSQSIQALEKELGTPLFDRTQSPVALTYAGELFTAWAQEALHSQEQTVRQIADVAQGTRTHLVVGVSYSRSAYIFAAVMGQFYQRRPLCTVSLLEGTTNTLAREEHLDLLIDVPHEDSFEEVSILLAEERMLLAIPPQFDCPIQEVPGDFPKVRLADLAKYPFVVLSEMQMLRRLCVSLCARCGFSPNIVLECLSLQTAHAMVEAGIGITLVPELFARYAVRENQVRYCVIADQPSMRKIAAIYRSDRYLSKDAQVMIELLQQMLGR